MKVGLAFSGGKDSWACLWLYADVLKDITVFWVNTGKYYPDVLATVEKARAMCPNFIEIRTDRDKQNLDFGIPCEVVPIKWTALGHTYSGAKPVKVQSYLDCCSQNISMPLHREILKQGITHIIRGQRLDETHKSPVTDGAVVDGLTYVQPIEKWTEAQVFEYLAGKMDFPDHFKFKHTSMDCYDCTAFGSETADRVSFTQERYPEFHREYLDRAQAVQFAVRSALGG